MKSKERVPSDEEARVDPKPSITAAAVRGAGWQLASVFAQALMQIAVLAALARLLSPRDFGIVGSATIIGGFANLFSQMGMAPAVVQNRNLTSRHVRVAFTVAASLGLIMAGAVYVSAPLAASFFSAPELEQVVRIYSVSFMFAAMGAVAEALLQRELAFRTLMKINLASYLVGYSAVAVPLALYGAGYWSLVYGIIGQRLLQTVLAFVARPHSVKPLFAASETREMVGFGAGYTLAQIFNYAATQGDYVIIGRVLGTPALGTYSRAYQLMMMPTKYVGQALSKVLFPAMASIQTDYKRLGRAYLRAIRLAALVILPVSLVMVLAGQEIIRVALGPGWDAAVVPFQILCAGVAFRATYKFSDSLAEATGFVLQRAVREFVYMSAVVAGAMGGSLWGLPGVAVGVVAAIFVNWQLGAHLSARSLGIRTRAVWAALAPGATLAIMVGIPSWITRTLLVHAHAGPYVSLLGVMVCAVAAGVGAFWISPLPIAAAVSEISGLLAQALPKGGVLGRLRPRLAARSALWRGSIEQ